MTDTERIVITSDLQIPFHNPRQVASHIRFIRDYQPDRVINIGDLTDFPEPSRWSKSTRAEFENSIDHHVETTKRVYFDPLRKVYDGPIGMHIGNHDLRPLDYKMRYAPALDRPDPTTDPYYYANLLDFDGYGVTDLGDVHKLANGWYSMHGHRGPSIRPVAGGTAIGYARKEHYSVVMGHTHRMGWIPETYGSGDRAQVVRGIEVGHMMDPKKAGYIQKKGGYANWQAGFFVLTIVKNWVQATPIEFQNKEGVFLFADRVWK